LIRDLFPREDLAGLARKRRRSNQFKTVKPEDVANYEQKGWAISKKNKKSIRMSRPKPKAIYIEDRVWSLLYRMGFSHLSGEQGAFLSVKAGNEKGPENQIDVVAVDDDVSIAIECKSAANPKRSSTLQAEIEHLSSARVRFFRAVERTLPTESKRMGTQAMFLWDVLPQQRDLETAKNCSVMLFDIDDIEYYEKLTEHLGPAAKYIFLSEIMAGRKIRGLEISVPALQAKMGKLLYYTFAISPEYLLKIASVAHRAGGHRVEVGAYQRMLEKKRLKSIAQYISKLGFFPTNIVINIDGKKSLQFDTKEHVGGDEGAKYGTLHIRPAYGCAWIIDGQHRLYAYSGHDRASSSYLNVIAFAGLSVNKQAELFIDINNEQKSVKRSLLQELFAVLKWGDINEVEQVRAIISRAIVGLDKDPESPLFQRILFTGQKKTGMRCITVNSVYTALNKAQMYIVQQGVEYGPLWTADREKTVERTVRILVSWLGAIASSIPAWWELGASEGGGIAMSDGVAMCIALLRSVFQHLESQGLRLTRLSVEELIAEITPFAQDVGRFLGNFNAKQQRDFRDGLRGNQGQTSRRRECEQYLQSKFPDFDPPGLSEYLELRRAQTNTRAFELISRIERQLKEIIITSLKVEFRSGDAWWYEGVPQEVRTKASARLEQDKGKGEREDHVDLLDYRIIIRAHWSVFRPILEYGGNGKEKGTSWIAKVNEIRKIVMHPSKNLPVSWEQLEELAEYSEMLDRHSTQ